MSKRGNSKKDVTKTIQGYIISEDKPTRRDEEFYSDDDDENYDFAGNYVKRVPLHATKVLVQTLDADGELTENTPAIYIYGKFPYLGLWWHLTMEVKVSNDAYYSQSLPCYRLRTDLTISREIFNRMISAALNSERLSSAAQSVETKVFRSFLDRQQVADFTPMYRIERLTELIQQCAAELSTEPEKAAMLSLISYLHNSTELKEINQAINHPVSVATLPLLHPRTAHSILKCGLEEASFMAKVEEMIVNSPYELAFRSVIKRKTGRVFREASGQNLEKAGLWAGMPQPYKDAVMVYGVLKEHCYGTGDTYMSIHRLNGQTKRYKGYILSEYSQAISYLKSNGSVVDENDRIYLKNLYDSESNVADTLFNMISGDLHFTFPTDFSSEPLNVLSTDPDQRRAAVMISANSVVVMSGRGGCGKTEVVSRVCKVALSTYYDIRDREYNNYIKQVVSRHVYRANASRGDNSMSQETPPSADAMAVCASETVHGGCLTADTSGRLDEEPGEEVKEEPVEEVKEELGEEVKEKPGEEVKEPGEEVKEEIKDDDGFSDVSSQSQGDLFGSSSDEEFTSVLQKMETSVDAKVNGELNEFSFSSGMSSGDFSSLVDEEEESAPPPIPDKSLKSYILLTAPTAKAAKVLGNRTGYTGYTIHQIMFRYMLWLREPPPKDPFPFKDVAILVVDECSLVAVSNISFLLYILKTHCNLQRIILLGDLQQLPSIEPGNFLPDVYAALYRKGCAISLRTNHRAEGRLIVENAIRISAKCLPTFDSERSFNFVQLKDKEHIELERDEAVKQLISTEAFKSDRVSQFVAFRRLDCEAINNICSKIYTGHICIDSATKRPLFHEGFKICCSRNGTVQVIVLHDPRNEAKDHLAPKADLMTPAHDTSTQLETDVSEEELTKRRMEFITQKISQHIKEAQGRSESEVISDNALEEIETQVKDDETALSQVKEREDNKSVRKSCAMRLCNGELFWIKAIFIEKAIPPKKFDQERWIIESEDGMTLSVYRGVLMKECRMKPSWCRTIHTFQGSEINHLAYVVGEAGRQNWQHVYTAVTRGKRSVTIIGDDSCLRKAINTSCQKRFCSLEEKLNEKFQLPMAVPDAVEEIAVDPVGIENRIARTVQYVSEDEFDMMVDDQIIWGDVSSSQPQLTNLKQANDRKRKLETITNKQTEDLFTQQDAFQQTFDKKISCSAPSEDIYFSTDDEDFFGSQEHKNGAGSGNHQTPRASPSYQVRYCEPLVGTSNDAIVLVPVSTEPS